MRIAELSIEIDILDEESLKDYSLGGLIPYEGNRGAIMRQPYGWVSCGVIEEMRTCCLFIPIGSKIEWVGPEGNFLYLNFRDNTYDVDLELNQEKSNIDENYDGKKTHKFVREDRFVIRKSYISQVKRYDIAIVKVYDHTRIILHGILKANDLNWTITAMRKMMESAILLDVKDESKSGAKI